MISIIVDTSDLTNKLNLLNTDALARDIADAVADEAVIPEGAKYPAAQHKPQPFVSAKQRRAFFAKLRSGAITVPYVRSGRLGGSAQKQPFTNGVAVSWAAPYSDIVIGERQGAYFDFWPNVTKIAQKIESDTAELIATAQTIEALEKAGLT